MSGSPADACALCRPTLAPILMRSAFWQLILNRNQNLLGKCFLVLRRHAESITELTPEEWTDLHAQVTLTTRLLTAAYQPDHFNYAFLQNQDRHVHFHVIPRYAAPRTFAGNTFTDPDFPGHYAVPAPVRHLSDADFTALADFLRQRACGVT